MNSFSKKDTNIVKGIAILAMVFHHLYPNNPGVPLRLEDFSDLTLLFATTGKVCVVLLTILSGYGLTRSWQKNLNVHGEGLIKNIGKSVLFSIEHYFQLLSMYWVVLLFAYICLFLYNGSIITAYGYGARAYYHMMLDILGLGSLSDGLILLGGWYLSAIVLYYFLFPIIYGLIKKFKIVPVILLYIPWVYYLVKQNPDMHTDWWMFYLFAFALGVYFAVDETLEKIQNTITNKMVAVIILAVTIIIRAYVTLPADVLVAFALILLERVVINQERWFGTALAYIGKNSANIWLLHLFVGMLLTDASVVTIGGQFILRFFICLAISALIETIKTSMNYNGCVMKVRNKIRRLG